MVSPLLGKLLAAHRAELNLRFERARLAQPSLEPRAVERAIAEWIDPVVTAVERAAPTAVEAVFKATYAAALEVLSSGLVSQCPSVSRVFTDVGTRAARWVAAEPERVLRALVRATVSVNAFPGSRPDEWLTAMAELSAHIDGVSGWLEAGKVIAWRCGLPSARASALNMAPKLDAHVAWRALGIPEGEAAVPLVEAVSRLQSDPWLLPKHAAMEKLPPRELQIVGICGDFTGFGGPFRRPPTVSLESDRLLARSGDEQFEIYADAFGVALLRVASSPTSAAQSDQGWKITPKGEVAKGELKHVFSELRSPGGSASSRSTLAVTFPHSHRIALVAAAAPR